MTVAPVSVRKKLFTVIFGTDTRSGRRFDIILLVLILISILSVCLESVPSLRDRFGSFFLSLEIFFTAIFTIEYLLRIYSHPKPLRYLISFYGIIDLISILPTYFLFFVSGHYLITIRTLRLLRVFRILKLSNFVHHAEMLETALIASAQKIIIFMSTIVSLVLIIGTIMYVTEGEEHGFTSIPTSIYWAVVTITTVGYGDLTPQTTLGQFFSTIVMIIGYAIIAVPTGIVTVELSRTALKHDTKIRPCPHCGQEMHMSANYCSHCGKELEKVED
ncbi:ion transporter [Rhabdobacter roseus]|uniref:Voltage-gated potassium channel n=1 Tax=Rhabdobacter roseus TaxID=1655419 RepID=A0A840TQU9_9BACT|nr:ion transporter [Rhabdobacter roseus]MBB5284097.1 voltage-gated potassium channel [Rhabdobacter roseus]